MAVGPEGGWSDEELASGLPTVGFGLSVLRAETAAVTAGALMASLRTGTVVPAGVTSPDGPRPVIASVTSSSRPALRLRATPGRSVPAVGSPVQHPRA